VDPELQAAFADVRHQIVATALETRQYIEATEVGMRRHVETTAAETRQHIEATEVGIRRHVETTAAETRRHFEVVAEGLRDDIRLIAEGLTHIDAVEIRLRDEIARSHDALAGLIRLAYVDLDRRIRGPEGRPPGAG
jgi:hypothetical protein